MTPDLKAYGAWLKANGYRESTIRKALADLKSYVATPALYDQASRSRQQDYWWTCALYDEFAVAKNLPPLVKLAPRPPKEATQEGRVKRKRKQLRALDELVSIEPDAWARLVALIRAGREQEPTDVQRAANVPADAVLDVMSSTGLRVNDVLRIPKSSLLAAYQRKDGVIVQELKGGKEIFGTVLGAGAAWSRLRRLLEARQKAINVAAAVARNGSSRCDQGAAYFACSRRFARLCELAGVVGDRNLHRIRRTVAVRLRAAGVSLDDLQVLLGHSDRETTAIYTSEYQAHLVAKVLTEHDPAGPHAVPAHTVRGAAPPTPVSLPVGGAPTSPRSRAARSGPAGPRK